MDRFKLASAGALASGAVGMLALRAVFAASSVSPAEARACSNTVGMTVAVIVFAWVWLTSAFRRPSIEAGASHIGEMTWSCDLRWGEVPRLSTQRSLELNLQHRCHDAIEDACHELGDVFIAQLPGESLERLFLCDLTAIHKVLGDASTFGLDKSLERGQSAVDTPFEISNLVQPMFLETMFDMTGDEWTKRRVATKSAYSPGLIIQDAFRDLCAKHIATWTGNQSSGWTRVDDIQTEIFILLLEATLHSLFGTDFVLRDKKLEYCARRALAAHVLHYQSTGLGHPPDSSAAVDLRNACSDALDDFESRDPLHTMGVPSSRKPVVTQMLRAGLNKEEIISTILNFVVAAAESPASAAAHMCAFISSNTEVRDALRQEYSTNCLDEPWGTRLKSCSFANAVVRESLRLRSPATMISRRALCESQLSVGDRRIQIPAGTRVAICIPVVHHDRKLWGDDAQQFNPWRFVDSPQGGAEAGANMPFSKGPRACPGANLTFLWLSTLALLFANNCDCRLLVPAIKLDEHVSKFVTWVPALPVELRLRAAV